MTLNKVDESKTSGGRPRADEGKKVYEKLVAAAESIIEQKGHFDVSDREIANAAGVTPAMINYYFQGHDGLLMSVVDRLSAKISIALVEVEQHLAEPELKVNLMRHLVRGLARSYAASPALTKLLIAELSKERSAITARFMTQYGPHRVKLINRSFERLVELGVYDPKMDTTLASFSLITMLLAPYMLGHHALAFGMNTDHLHNDVWIDHVVDLFNSKYQVRDTRKADIPKRATDNVRRIQRGVSTNEIQ